jgi:UDP-N-acetylmuramate--alanine ligase
VEMNCVETGSEFRLRSTRGDLGRFQLNVPGRHNVLNAAAAIAVALELDVKPGVIREGLAGYSGVDRRFQLRGRARDISVIDDYGHHPTEIRATLATARLCGYRRVLVIFQPHRYTRTFHLMDEFGGAFHQADRLFMLDIYAASEKPIEGVTAQALVDRIRSFGHRSVEHVGTLDKAVEAVLAAAREGDVVLTLGAGNVWQAGERILASLKAGGAHGA